MSACVSVCACVCEVSARVRACARQLTIAHANALKVGELVTPTGACLVAEAATEGAAAWPAGGFVAERVGYGAGSRRVAGRANLFAVVVGRRVGGV